MVKVRLAVVGAAASLVAACATSLSSPRMTSTTTRGGGAPAVLWIDSVMRAMTPRDRAAQLVWPQLSHFGFLIFG